MEAVGVIIDDTGDIGVVAVVLDGDGAEFDDDELTEGIVGKGTVCVGLVAGITLADTDEEEGVEAGLIGTGVGVDIGVTTGAGTETGIGVGVTTGVGVGVGIGVTTGVGVGMTTGVGVGTGTGVGITTTGLVAGTDVRVSITAGLLGWLLTGTIGVTVGAGTTGTGVTIGVGKEGETIGTTGTTGVTATTGVGTETGTGAGAEIDKLLRTCICCLIRSNMTTKRFCVPSLLLYNNP